MFKNVLFVEDEEIELLKFRKIMSKHFPKVNVIVATNGEQALSLINDEKLKVNMILLDLTEAIYFNILNCNSISQTKAIF